MLFALKDSMEADSGPRSPLPRTPRHALSLASAGLLAAALTLNACSTGTDEQASPTTQTDENEMHSGHGEGEMKDGEMHAGMNLGDMKHPADGGPVPAGMTEATDPKYPVGNEVTLSTDHMEGMQGAKATIVGAYATYVYAIDYTPTTGGDPVRDHRWVVQEEIADAGSERLADGASVTVNADHVEGMDGGAATVSSSTDETVYVVDYEAGGMKMTNHKWVTESEIQPAA
ncbi:YdhK family protein [Corynebacterium flavescens]|nr:YdhK family protein [Corynebacterium flavescens]MDN6647033.1 YdhK family protein [Corynebacterium flavescens]MDN6687786.1 YdhK family protein [Corynebacterium flavescens]GEB97064.1 hypothetical protein CFL01nite_05590 [Corynebacterium flavescens]